MKQWCALYVFLYSYSNGMFKYIQINDNITFDNISAEV